MRLTRYRDILARAETRATDSRPGRALHSVGFVFLAFRLIDDIATPRDRDSSRRLVNQHARGWFIHKENSRMMARVHDVPVVNEKTPEDAMRISLPIANRSQSPLGELGDPSGTAKRAIRDFRSR